MMQQLLLMLGILTMALSCSKNLSGLLNGTTTKHCLNSFHKFTTKNKLEFHQKLYENKDFSNVIMSSEDTKTL